MSFTVAIIGRPNVGKSTLFNRLVGRRLALVHDMPGVTRDRREGMAVIGDLEFRVIDTAGLEEAGPGTLEQRMRGQTEAAIVEADLVLFLIDARTGLMPMDGHFAELLRASGRPVTVIANKSEGRAGEAGFYEAYSLGLGEPLALSAEHGEGMSDLFEVVRDARAAWEDAGGVEAGEDEDDPTRPIRIAIVGRPNAGKSTLVNALLGEDRMLTGPEAGITRDSISVELTHDGQRYKVFDTAGLRRKARVAGDLEKLSVADALRAIRFAEVVILLLDAEQPFEKQDLQIAALVASEGRALVIAVNKWDLVKDKKTALKELNEMAGRLLPQVKGVPVITVTALRGRGLDRLMAAVRDVYTYWNRRVSTGALNRWLIEAVAQHSPPAVRGKRLRLRYMTQPNARPPTFVAFCSRPEKLPESYLRYLINGLREAFGIPAVPIRFMLRKSRNPYTKR